jgi:drug/metabolite transporter (DMT)-like permease
VLIGPRLALVLMTLSPLFAALLARVCLGQTLTAPKAGALLATLAGVALVVRESARPGRGEAPGFRPRLAGVALGVGAALGDAAGMLLSKVGMADGAHVISANLIRVAAGAAGTGVWLLVRIQFLANLRRLRDPRALLLIAGGAALGPVLGVLLALYAIRHAPMGVAATLMSLAPVFVIPLSMALFRERVTGRAALGTLVSLLGACALFFP